MRIRIEEEIYTGTPREIMKQIWENSFDKAQFPDLEGYIRHLCEAFTRMTDVPCKKEPGYRSAGKGAAYGVGGYRCIGGIVQWMKESVCIWPTAAI